MRLVPLGYNSKCKMSNYMNIVYKIFGFDGNIYFFLGYDYYFCINVFCLKLFILYNIYLLSE